MGLTSWIERSSTGHVHVLMVEAPGHWGTRAAAERFALARGWHLALSPADADVLVVCGKPGPQLAGVIERVWEQMPGPRVRVDVHQLGEVGEGLTQARAELLDTARHRADARSRPATPRGLSADDGDHGDMDHGDMDMSPGGIPLAEGGEDRDGLEMDVLNVRLGPVLAHWPAGLVLRCALQGDVITEAEAELLDDAIHVEVPHGVAPRAVTARRVDNVVALLALSGWDQAAAQARLIRDQLLEDGEEAAVSVAIARLVRRLRRSSVLRWSLRGIRPITEADLRRRGLPAGLVGDTYDRLLWILDRVETAVDGKPFAVHHLPELITGLDLATARLVVASLDLHELRADRSEYEAAHG